MKVLFIDRDGTLINEPPDGYINSLEKLHIIPEAVSALQKLQSEGFTLVMVSNQPGLGTPKFPESDFWLPQNALMKLFAENNIQFAETFFCPHFREDNCACMKPKTGLVEVFLKANSVDLTHSFVIGDRETDLQLAQNIGCGGIFFSNTSHSGAVYCSNSWNSISNYLIGN